MPRPKMSLGGSEAMPGVLGALRSLNVYRDRLVAQRSTIDSQIAAIENALAAMGSAAPRSSQSAGSSRPQAYRGSVAGAMTAGGRSPRAGSLKEYIVRVLAGDGGIMAVKDVTNGVLRAGYKSKNKTLAKSVGIALTELKGVAKVGRGRFRLK